MNKSLAAGLSFGLTSGVITTMGLMVGIYATTSSKLAVVGAILTVAIADAFSDALGIHISRESENSYSNHEIWQSTISTFIFKFLFGVLLIVPVLLFELKTAVLISVAIGLSLLFVVSYFVALQEKAQPIPTAFKHLAVALIVVLITHYLGAFIKGRLGL